MSLSSNHSSGRVLRNKKVQAPLQFSNSQPPAVSLDKEKRDRSRTSSQTTGGRSQNSNMPNNEQETIVITSQNATDNTATEESIPNNDTHEQNTELARTDGKGPARLDPNPNHNPFCQLKKTYWVETNPGCSVTTINSLGLN